MIRNELNLWTWTKRNHFCPDTCKSYCWFSWLVARQLRTDGFSAESPPWWRNVTMASDHTI